MKAGSGDDRRVGEAKVLEIAAVVSMAVRTVGANRRGIRKAARRQLGVLPEFLPSPYGIGIAQGRRPRAGVFLGECVGLQNLARITGKEIEGHDSKTACDAIGLVEAEPNGVGALDHGVRWERQGHLERREPAADSAIALARLCDGDCVVVQRQPRAVR